MQLSLPEHFSVQEAASILGGAKVLDERTTMLCEKAFFDLSKVAVPRMCDVILTQEQMQPLIIGTDLKRHVKNCDSAVLMAVTIGTGVEQLLRKTQLTDLAYAVIMDACASAMIEAVADKAQEILIHQAKARNQYLTGRFSPGYGDSPLSLQAQFLSLLDAPRKIGLCETQTHLLTPRKSITAILGQANTPVTGTLAGCATCALRETCQKRKEGNPCNGVVSKQEN